MKYRTLLIIVVLSALIFCAGLFFSNKENSGPIDTVKKFTENLMKSSSPEFNNDAIKTAAEQLSTKARSKINDIFSLANFAGISGTPVDGFKIVEYSEKDNKGFVKAVWEQAGKHVTKIFNLTYEDGKWKIDSIKSRES